MKKMFSKIKSIELLPVFIPLILSLSSWTIYKVAHKSNEHIKPIEVLKQNTISPFKINRDFLKSYKYSEDTRALEIKDIIPNHSSSDSTSVFPLQDKAESSGKASFEEKKQPYSVSSSLVNSGYMGEIGNKDEKSSDRNPSDNIFDVQLGTINPNSSYTLTYDVDGFSDLSSVTRSINGSFAVGGYVQYKKSGWNEVSEAIDPALLKNGSNMILFNALNKGDYYYIKNVRISENRKSSQKPFQIISRVYKDKVLYIRGFIDPSSGINSVEIAGENVDLRGNEFEYLSLKENKDPSVNIKFTNKDQSVLQEVITKEKMSDAVSEINSYKEIGKNIVYKNESGILLGLRNIDLPPVDLSVINVSNHYFGFRFKNTASKEVVIHLPYDESILPKGYRENDITALAFDYAQKRWTPISIDSVNIKKKYLIFKALPGSNTDYISGVIKQPESPETSAFTPTTVNDVPIANPTSKINVISPPTANQEGSAVVQYPIEIPAGINGFQPNISITYNSDSKSGWAGTGWDIPTQTVDIDTRWGVPAFSLDKESEIYIIGGEQLVFKDNYLPNKVQTQENRTSGDRRFHFRKGVTEATFITRKGSSPTSYTWEILDGNGTKKEYADYLTDNPSNNSSGNRIRWFLTKVTDRFGNIITYSYTDSFDGGGKNKYLSSITYSNNTVITFENEPGVRQDMTFNYKLGVKITDAKILTKITVRRANIKIREYQLMNTQAGQFSKRLLTEIIQKDGSGNEFNRHKFTYNKTRIFDDKPTKEYDTGYDVGNAGPFNGGNTSAIGGGFSDNINKIRGSINIGSGAGCFLFSFNKKNTFGINGSYSEHKSYGMNQLMDIDGDGLPDKVFYGGNGRLWFRKNNMSSFGGVYSSVGWIPGTRMTKTSSYMGSVGLEFIYKKYAAGVNLSWTNSNTPTYFSDVNADGLPDFISYGEVFFSRIRNGVPEFEAQQQNGPNVTETTPNAILDGEPAVQVIEPGYTGPKFLGNIVRMWEAPVSGQVHVTTNVALEQQSTDGVSVWMELGGMTKAYEDDPNYVPPHATLITQPVTLTTPGQSVPLTATIDVRKGQRIFVIASAKDDSVKDRIASTTEISYLSANPAAPLADANGNYYYGFSSSYSYLPSSKKGNLVGEKAKVKISWNTLPSQEFTDDVDLKIYKVVVPKSDTTGVALPNTANLIYHRKLLKGANLNTVTTTTNQISGYDLSNLLVNQVVSDSTVTFFNFDVSADTNVSWEKIKWKPQIEAITDTDTLKLKALVQYNPYSERLTENIPKDFGQYSPLDISGCRYLLYPKYGANIDDIITLNLPQPHNTTVTFSLKLKSSTGNIYTFKNKVNVINNVMPMPRIDYCQVADQMYSQYGITDDQMYQMLHYFEISSLDYDVAKYLAAINPEIYNSNFEPNGLSVGSTIIPPSTGHRADHVAYRANNTHYNINTGLVYQGWGGFSYNGSKYPGGTIRESEFNSTGFGIVNIQNPSIPCSGDPASQAYQDCLTNYINQQINTRYFTPLDLKEDAETYTSPVESAELSQYHMQPAHLGVFSDPGSESMYPGFAVPNPRGIIKYSKGTGINIYGSAFVVGGNAGFSKDITKDHFLDFNGDRYPDVVSGYSFQKTNVLGQLGTAASTFDKEMYNHTSNIGVGLGVPVPTKFSNTSNGGFSGEGGKNTHTTTSANAVGIGLDLQLGKASSKSKAVWFDINGDGLLDFVSDNTLYVNNGRSFVSEPYNWDMSNLSNNTSSSLSGGGGISWPNGSLSFGVGLSKSKSIASTAFLDLNGDGMDDKIVKSGNSYEMLMNTGTSFTSEMMSKDFEIENKQNSSGFNLYGTICICFGVKFCIGLGYNKDKSVTKQTVDLRDFDGDGLPDLLISDDETKLKYYHNNLDKSNLLLTIENPLQGKIQLDYDSYNIKGNLSSHIGGTYQMPFSKVALTKVTVWDFKSKNAVTSATGTFEPQGLVPRSQMTFEYEKGVQDRREREFLGFGVVKTKTYGGEEGQPFVIHQTHVTEYETSYNSSDFFVNYDDTKVRQYFYKKGLVRASYTLDASGRKRSETKNTYRYFDQESTGGYQLSEGQAEPQYKDIGRIIPFLYKTENTVTEFSGSNSHSKTTISTMDSYDKFGNVTQYTDRGTTLANTTDDVKVNITYHAPGTKNIVGIPAEQIVTANAQQVRRNATQLDSNQNVKKIQKFLGALASEYDMEYDTYGNLTKITHPASNNGQRLSYTYKYDLTYHTYLTEVKDSYNFITTTQYDANYLFGVPTVITDINGVSSQYTYDSFGRVVQYKSPVDYDWTMKFYYYPSEVIPVAVTERKAPVVNGNTPSVNYFSSIFTSAWGQELAMKKLFKKENGNYYFANNIYQIRDNLGRPVKTILRDKVTSGTNIINSLKIYDDYLISEDQAAQIYTTTLYDDMGRPASSTQHNVQTNSGVQNLTAQNIYGFGPDRNGITQFSQTTISPLGNTSVTYTDEKGRTTSSKQTDGYQDLWVSYQYDLLNQLLEVKDPADHITQYQYDGLGRKIYVKQPDAGETELRYDLSGKLVSADNSMLKSLGQTINYYYNYDQLIHIDYGPGDYVNYEYGSTPGGPDFSAGRLARQTDRTGTQTFKYTELGQLRENTRIVVAPHNVPKLFKTSFVYDIYNRINKITYPDSEEVYYNYNMAGLLDNIWSKPPVDPNMMPIVEAITYDSRDQMVSYRAGNGTKNIYDYDLWGRMKELSLIYDNGTNIRKNQYTFDGNGNVAKIIGSTPLYNGYPSEDIAVASEKNYTYDLFGRLSSSVITAKNKNNSSYYKLNMEYNDAGNMKVKDFGLKHYQNNIACQNSPNQGNAGTYSYDNPDHPNAVSKIEYSYHSPFTGPLDCGPVMSYPYNGAETFTYDLNGNLTNVSVLMGDGNYHVQRQLFWSLQNYLKGIAENEVLNHYVYDDGGERVLKSDGADKRMYIDGNDPKTTTQMGAYTYYPSGYLVLSEKTMSKHYYIGGEKIATKVSNIPSHRFKINLGDVYEELRMALEKEVDDLAVSANYPPVVWVPNEDSQGSYNPPSSTLTNESDCAYVIEQQIIIFEQDPAQAPCFEKLKEMYNNVLASGGSFCALWDEFLKDECMVGQTPPEILESDIYWIHPDHLGSSSVLTNYSSSKVTNWHEYMPYGESLMELSTQDYNNPYRFNGKEMDITGLYYYGARYYDPQRSFWMSVDPLVEITMSPYAYTWNDPVNYADPTGMIGERIGGPTGWGRRGNKWEWKSEITKDNYKKLGYAEYSDGYTNNQYNSVNNTTVTLGQGGHWSEVPNTGYWSGFKNGLSDWKNDAKTFFTETIFTEQFWGETAESFFSNGHTNIPDYGKWNSYQWGHATGYETPNVAVQVASYALTKTNISLGTKTFYTVQGVEDVARLRSSGTPWPSSPTSAHFGEGVYAWGSRAEAQAYHDVLKKQLPELQLEIMEFKVSKNTFRKFKKFEVPLDDDLANSWLEKHSSLFGNGEPHGFQYIKRSTGMGHEHYFNKSVFKKLQFKK